MCRICFQACFFRFDVILNRFFSDGPSVLAESDFSLSAKRFLMVWIDGTRSPCLHMKNAPNFIFSGR